MRVRKRQRVYLCSFAIGLMNYIPSPLRQTIGAGVEKGIAAEILFSSAARSSWEMATCRRRAGRADELSMGVAAAALWHFWPLVTSNADGISADETR